MESHGPDAEVGGADIDAGQDLLTATEGSKTTATYRSAAGPSGTSPVTPPEVGCTPPPHWGCVWVGVERWREGGCSPGNRTVGL